MEKFRARQIFIPGGQPTFTYNPRLEFKLEERLAEASDFLCKLVMMTGSTKSGKTVLTNKVFPKSHSVWFDGGSYSTEQDFWTDILEQLNGYTNVSETKSDDITNKSEIKGEAEKQLLLFNFKGGLSTSRQKKKGTSRTKTIKGNPKTLAIQALRNTMTPLIIDDFHYLPRDHQAQVVRAVKALIFDGLPVIFIAIPHRRLDAVKVEKEMTGRIESIPIPAWDTSELSEIPRKGFPLLNVKIDESLIDFIAEQAIGSPHLMQEFCRGICDMYFIKETLNVEYEINAVDELKLFSSVAENTGKVIFDKLSKGPRQRADRVPRKLTNGQTTDIYGLVLTALAFLKPGLDTLEYEQLRSAIREVSEGDQPQAHEVTRVLDKMSEIASSDESSTPVIDYEKDERILHITDPFFAFYLRWGVQNNSVI